MGRTIALLVIALTLLVTTGSGAILRDPSKLWPIGRPIPFAFEGFVAPGVREAVARALEEYSEKTCLRFKPAVRGVDRTTINFSSDFLDRCYQSASGFKGDGHDHPIYIHPDCPGGIDIFTQALHETGRALGLIDLQRRPDRGQFLSIRRSRVRNNPAEREMFERMEWDEVSLEGVEDFKLSSVMLYGEFFLSQNGQRTMFPKKSGATLKARKFKLGRGDIAVLNRAYNCPGPATLGTLTIDLVKKRNLHPPELIEVIAEAVDTDGLKTVRTARVSNTGSRDIVDTSMDFGMNFFQYVRITARSGAVGQTDTVLLSMLVPVVKGNTNKKLCEEPGQCDKNIRFRLNYAGPPSTAVCGPHACENDGVCHGTGGGSFRCTCRKGFAGRRCQFRYGELSVVVVKGQNLFNRDSGADALSDPFVNITARNAAGNTLTKPSLVKVNTLNPDWNLQRLNFGSSTWVELDAQVLDFDPGNAAEPLTPIRTKDLHAPVFALRASATALRVPVSKRQTTSSSFFICGAGADPQCITRAELRTEFRPLNAPVNCPIGQTGASCELVFASLEIKVVRMVKPGVSIFSSRIEVATETVRCVKKVERTSAKSGFGTVNWNESFSFGSGVFKSVTVKEFSNPGFPRGLVLVPTEPGSAPTTRRVCKNTIPCDEFIDLEISYQRAPAPGIHDVTNTEFLCPN